MNRAPGILAAIGNTPIVELENLRRELGFRGRILAKLEYLQPGLTKKTRVARQVILDGLETGTLKAGQMVIEATSGNTGTGLAIVCAALGHPFTAVISKGNSVERVLMMRAMGASVVLVDQRRDSVVGRVTGDDFARVEEATESLVARTGAFRANQFESTSNTRAHYLGTAPEFWDQSHQSLQAFVHFTGTGGAFAGCMNYFSEVCAGFRGYVVEPEGAAALSGGRLSGRGHVIQGGGYSRSVLPLLTGVEITGFLSVRDQAAVDGCHILARREGIFTGYSSGANLMAAVDLLRSHDEDVTVGILLSDSGLKYASTGLFTA